jgi:hypothetical protein
VQSPGTTSAPYREGVPSQPFHHRVATPEELAAGDLYPRVRSGFEDLGFTVIGGVVVEQTPEQMEAAASAYTPSDAQRYREHAALPETTLAARDGSAFVGISWFWDTPAITMVTLLEDGELVETTRAWTAHPPWPVRHQRMRSRMSLREEQQLGATRGHPVHLVETDDPAVHWAAHRRHVAKRAHVEHRTIEQRRAILSDQHDAARRSVDNLNRLTWALQGLGALLVVLAVVLTLTGVVDGPVAVVLIALSAGLFWGVGAAHPRLRHAQWLRAEFRPVRAGAAAQP